MTTTRISDFLQKYGLVLFITCFGFFLRIYGLGERSFWGDEIMTVMVAKLPWMDFLRMRIMAPVLYLLVRFFMIFGENELNVRLPSFIAGVVTIPILYRVGNDFFNHYVGLSSSFMLALSVFHIRQSQEARYYTLLTLFFLLSFYFLFRALREKKRNFWIFWIASVVLAILTITPGYLIAISEGVFLILILGRELAEKVLRKRTSIFHWFILILSLILFMLFVIYILFPSVEHQSLGEFIEEWGERDIHEKLKNPRRFFLHTFSYFWAGVYPTKKVIEIFPLFVVVNLLGLGLLFFRKRQKVAIFFIILFLIPLLILLVMKPTHDIVPKHLIFWLPALFLLVSVAIEKMARIIRDILAFLKYSLPQGLIVEALVVLVYLLPTYSYLILYYQRPLTHDLQGMARIVKERGQKGDLVIFNDNLDITPIGIPYYLDRIFHSNEYWQKHGRYIVSIPQERWIEERTGFQKFDLYGMMVSLCPDCVKEASSKSNSIWFISSKPFDPKDYNSIVKEIYPLRSVHKIYRLKPN